MKKILLVLVMAVLFAGCTGPTEPERPGIEIITTEIPQWTSGESGSFTLKATGGTQPYAWAVTAGELPSGLALNAGGVISGIHILAAGTSKSISPPFTVTATDANGKNGTAQLTMTITEAPPEIETLSATCTVGVPCNAQIAVARGGTPPYTFQQDTLRGGFLPFGVTIGVDGFLTGKADKPGPYQFGVCVKDTVALSDCKPATLDVEEYVEPIPEGMPAEGYWSGKITWQIPANCYSREDNFGVAGWTAKYDPGESKLYDFIMAGFGITVAGPGAINEGTLYKWDYPVGEKIYKVEATRNLDKISGTVVLEYEQWCKDADETWRTIYYQELRGVLEGQII